MVGKDNQRGVLPDARFFRRGNYPRDLRVGRFSCGIRLGTEGALFVFPMIDHSEMQQKKIRLFIFNGVTGGVGPYRVRKLKWRHIRFESRELRGYFFERCQAWKGRARVSYLPGYWPANIPEC